jgi:inner membrane protein
MDNLCHSLAGAAIAEAVGRRRLPRVTLLGVIAANIPDVDALTYVFAGPSTAVAFRRGWTHGLPALATWALLLCTAFAWWAARRPTVAGLDRGDPPADHRRSSASVRWHEYLPVAAVAVVSHPVLDWMNTYGVRFLMPFSDRWFYGDTLFIVDPVLIVLFAAAWYAGRWTRRRGRPGSPFPARVVLGAALAYIVAMKGLSAATRTAAIRSAAPSGTTARDVMVAPRALRWLERDVLVRRGDVYEWRQAGWSGLTPSLSAPGYTEHHGADSATVAEVRASPRGRDFLRWARFPYFVRGDGADSGTIFVGDARYSDGTSESSARPPSG